LPLWVQSAARPVTSVGLLLLGQRAEGFGV
jgi:hypothetical protein